VVSRTLRDAGDDRILLATSLESALSAAASIAALAGSAEFFVIGGESVYRQALPVADRIYLTRIHQDVTGDRRMPANWLEGFELLSQDDVSDPESLIRYSFLDYRRAQT
jgi:dihydrofolate reductase